MNETRYGKFFSTYEATPKEIEHGRTGIARVDYNMIEGCNFYWVHWNLPRSGDKPPGMLKVGHPPHIHKDPEILMLIGTDPDNPTDLGAEVELHMGAEREKHLITKLTDVICIPRSLEQNLNVISKLP